MHEQFRPFAPAPCRSSATPEVGGRKATTLHRRALVSAATLVMVLAGCGGSDESGASGDDRAERETTTSAADAPAATTPGETSAAGTSVPLTPACDRFSPAELDAALGQTFGAGTADDDGQVCLWEADASNQVSLTVRPGGVMTPEVRCDTMATPNSERLELGDDPAVLEGRQIFVCGTDQSFNLLLNVSLPEDEMRRALIDLATIGSGR